MVVVVVVEWECKQGEGQLKREGQKRFRKRENSVQVENGAEGSEHTLQTPRDREMAQGSHKQKKKSHTLTLWESSKVAKILPHYWTLTSALEASWESCWLPASGTPVSSC